MLVLFSNCTTSNQFNKLPIISLQAFQYDQQGNILTDKKNYDEALSNFNKAIQLMPANSYFFCDRGRAYWLSGKNSEAMADFNRAIGLYHSAAIAYFYRGAVYMKDEKVDQAILEFDMAIQRAPEYAAAYLYRGIAYEKIGEINKADLDKKRAKELNPRVETLLKTMINPEIDETPVDPDTIYTLAEVDTPPRVVYFVPLYYPTEAKKNKNSVYLKVKCVVTKEGKAKDITIEEASLKGVFKDAAIQAVEQYFFNPAVKNGQVVNASVVMPIEFNVIRRGM